MCWAKCIEADFHVKSPLELRQLMDKSVFIKSEMATVMQALETLGSE
jgi:hypothetical protein